VCNVCVHIIYVIVSCRACVSVYVCVCVHVRECASTSERCHQSSAVRGHGGNASSPYRSFLRATMSPRVGEGRRGKSNALPAGSTARLRICISATALFTSFSAFSTFGHSSIPRTIVRYQTNTIWRMQ